MGTAELRDLVYNMDTRYKQYEKSLFENKRILDENKKLFRKFINSGIAEGLSKNRIIIYLRMLKIIGECADFVLDKKATREDIERLMINLRKRRYSAWTMQTILSVLKKYYRWLYGLSSNEPLPSCVSWIKGEKPNNKLKKEDLLTEDEVRRMVLATDNLMHRALISVFYEGALRPLELLSMRIKDITFNEHYVKIYVRGKMEKKMGDREVFLIKSYDALKAWLEVHPEKDNPDVYVWFSKHHNKPITLSALEKLLKTLGKKAGIKKRIYPYLFRHSRALVLYKELGEALAKKFMGHAPDSRMARVYCHLAEEDVLEALLEKHGLKHEEKKDDKEKCPRCGYVNSYGSLICSRCGMALSLEGAVKCEVKNQDLMEKMEKLLRLAELIESSPEIMRILEDPEWQRKAAERLVKRGA